MPSLLAGNFAFSCSISAHGCWLIIVHRNYDGSADIFCQCIWLCFMPKYKKRQICLCSGGGEELL